MKIIGIRKELHGPGTLAGKPCVTIEIGGDVDMKPEVVVSGALAMNCSFFRFTGDCSEGADLAAVFYGLRDGSRRSFMAAEATGERKVETAWDFLTVLPLLDGKGEALDRIFRSDTKLQVVFYIDGMPDMKALDGFLRRNFLIERRRIPLILVARNDSAGNLLLAWGSLGRYNARIFKCE